MARNEEEVQSADFNYSDTLELGENRFDYEDIEFAFSAGVEQADNHTDLSALWHDIVEEPVQHLTVAYATKNNKLGTLGRVTNNRWTWYIEKYGIIKWAYLDDLLPKGGE